MKKGIIFGATILVLICGWFLFAPKKYGGSEILPPSGGGSADLTKVTTNILPTTNNTLDLGAYGKSFKNVYSSGTIFAANLSLAGNLTVSKLTANVSSTLATIGTLWNTKLINTNESSTLGTFTTLWSTKSNSIYVSSTSMDLAGYFKVAGKTTLGNTSSTLGTFTTLWSNKLNPVYVSSTAITMVNGYFTNFIGSMVTTTNLGLAANGNIKVNGSNPKRTIVLSGAGAWSPTTGGNLGTYQTEMSTYKQNFQYVQFSSTTIQAAEWTVAMPCNYDGGTITASYYLTATSSVAGNVVMATKARAYITGDDLNQAYGTAVSSTVTMDGTLNNLATSTDSGAITIGGSPRGCSLVQFRVMRDGASASDTMGTTADMIAVMLKYGVKSFSDF